MFLVTTDIFLGSDFPRARLRSQVCRGNKLAFEHSIYHYQLGCNGDWPVILTILPFAPDGPR